LASPGMLLFLVVPLALIAAFGYFLYRRYI
jgi:hypothetical protein